MNNAFAVRMAVWTLLVLYMLCDFFLFKGPLKRELTELFPTPDDDLNLAINKKVCAKVFNTPIYLSQVNRRVTENLWRNGKSLDKVNNDELIMLRWQAVNDLVDEHLVRIKIRVNVEQVPIAEEVIDAEVARFEKRFEETGDLDAAMKAQGIESRKELRYRLAARLQQEMYVQSKIEPSILTTEEQAREWYDENKETIKTPERRRVRHVFLATLDRNPELYGASLKAYYKRLLNGETTFGKLASDVSEDERSNKVAGDLGWMTAERVLPEFAKSVFSLSENTPTLIQTKLGWHIVEVTGIKPAEIPSFELMKAEIITSLQDSQREDAITQYRHQLRLLNFGKIDIYRDVIESL